MILVFHLQAFIRRRLVLGTESRKEHRIAHYTGGGGGWFVMWSTVEAGVAGVCSLLSQSEVGELHQLFILMSQQIAASKLEYYHFIQQFCLL